MADGSEQQIPTKKFKNSDGLELTSQAGDGGSTNNNANKINTGNNPKGVLNLIPKRTTQLPVMRCIGILPSLPIVGHWCDSDDSNSSLEDMVHTVLPTVPRQRRDDDGEE